MTGDDEAVGDEAVGDDEVGETTGEPVELGSSECIHNPNDAFVGIQYQCEGDLYTSITLSANGDDCADILGGFCDQEHIFGTNFQEYAAAEVVACCGEYDFQYAEKYKEHCAYDMYQQTCISLAERMEYYIEKGAFGAYAKEAANVQVWIANHYDQCFMALMGNNSKMLPEVESYWDLGDFGELHDVVLHIDSGTPIYGVNLPVDSSEWLACSGANGNNDQVFEDTATPGGVIVAGADLVADVDGKLSGPSILGGNGSASATFPAACLARGCPAAMFSYDTTGSLFTLEDLNLYTGPFDITNGTYSLTVERAQIELWTQASGKKVYDPTGVLLGYVVPAGAAHFLVSGVAELQSNRFMAVNSKDLWVTDLHGIWTVGAFDIEYEDGNGELWTIMLEASQWQ